VAEALQDAPREETPRTFPNVFDAIASAGERLQCLVPDLLHAITYRWERTSDAIGADYVDVDDRPGLATYRIFANQWRYISKRARCVDHIKALGDIGPAAKVALGALEKAATENRWDIRAAAKEAIAAISL
jgi:hypothetical protein